VSSSSPLSRIRAWAGDRERVGRASLRLGAVGVIAAIVVGISGWVLAGRAIDSVNSTIEPIGRIVVDVADSIAASQVLFDQTADAIESIESATRSAVRTTESVGDVLTQTAELAGGDIADSLDSAVDALPPIIATSRVIDGTMRALSLVGVDYDPDAPLDLALTDLETSLAPIPDQIRQQADLLAEVEDDLAGIAEDGRELSAILLETRLEMENARRVLSSASANAQAAAERIEEIESEVATYDALARTAAVAAAVALLVAASTPLLFGLYMTRGNPQDPDGQAAT
jgi:chromosome segregation ATPase